MLVLLLLAGVGLLGACVDRTLLIKSDPDGALVSIDNVPRGTTPVEIPFTYYGTRQVLIEKDGYQTRRELVEVEAPFHQTPVIDIVTDVLIPWTIEDEHAFEFVLEPRTVTAGPVDLTPLLERAAAMRDEAEKPPEE